MINKAGKVEYKDTNLSRNRRNQGNPNWKGGRHKLANGYVEIMLQPNDIYFSMANQIHYIREHRLVMAKSLGRLLSHTEHVHHINGIRDDNRRENLELISPADHTTYKQMCAHCGLRKEIRLLRLQVKEQSEQIKLLTTRLMGIKEGM
jgi:hypothetical protein